MPKLNIKKVPTPNAISHRISNNILEANDIGFQFPKVLIRKWMKPTIGIPITKMPEMDISIVGNGDEVTTDQSTSGIAW